MYFGFILLEYSIIIMAATIQEKAFYALISAVIFVLVSNQYTYSAVDYVFGNSNLIALGGCPTTIGLFLHSLVFFLLQFLVMWYFDSRKPIDQQISKTMMAKYSFYGTLLFFIVSNPETYKLVNMIGLGKLGDGAGCPNVGGLLLHTVVFFLLVFGVMFFPKDTQ